MTDELFDSLIHCHIVRQHMLPNKKLKAVPWRCAWDHDRCHLLLHLLIRVVLITQIFICSLLNQGKKVQLILICFIPCMKLFFQSYGKGCYTVKQLLSSVYVLNVFSKMMWVLWVRGPPLISGLKNIILKYHFFSCLFSHRIPKANTIICKKSFDLSPIVKSNKNVFEVSIPGQRQFELIFISEYASVLSYFCTLQHSKRQTVLKT